MPHSPAGGRGPFGAVRQGAPVDRRARGFPRSRVHTLLSWARVRRSGRAPWAVCAQSCPKAPASAAALRGVPAAPPRQCVPGAGLVRQWCQWVCAGPVVSSRPVSRGTVCIQRASPSAAQAWARVTSVLPMQHPAVRHRDVLWPVVLGPPALSPAPTPAPSTSRGPAKRCQVMMGCDDWWHVAPPCGGFLCHRG